MSKSFDEITKQADEAVADIVAVTDDHIRNLLAGRHELNRWFIRISPENLMQLIHDTAVQGAMAGYARGRNNAIDEFVAELGTKGANGTVPEKLEYVRTKRT